MLDAHTYDHRAAEVESLLLSGTPTPNPTAKVLA
jgi:hypothetical protein